MRKGTRNTQLIPLRFSSEHEPASKPSGKSLHWRVVHQSHLWRPPTDVYETEAAFVVLVEIAGMRGKEFQVTFDKKKLSVRGARSDSKQKKAYHQMEIAYGDFATDVDVPVPVDVSTIEANYNDGFLKVILPKRTPTRVPVKD
jgi:HSP20 family molecular chaperone IbpA